MLTLDKNTWIGGMDQDTSKSKYQNNKYYELKNGKIVTQGGLSTGSIENEDGTRSVITFSDIPSSADLGAINNSYPLQSQNDIKIIGWVLHRNDIIIFTTTNDGIGQIWICSADSFGFTTHTILNHTSNLKFIGNLNFNPDYRIRKIICRYEYGDNITGGYYKIYWTDGYNVLKHLNIYESENYISGTTIVDIPVTSLQVLVNVGYSEAPSLSKVISGGNFKSGMVQYAYQFYKKYGAESKFSPASRLIHLTSSDEYSSTSKNYYGNPIDISTGKAIEINLPAGNPLILNKVRVISLFYPAYTATPTIKVIADLDVTAYTRQIIDYDLDSIDIPPTLEEYSTLGGNIFICQDIEVKDNRLIAANLSIPGGYNPLYDARCYRYNSSGIADIYNSDGVTGNIQLTSPTSALVPDEHDCYNTFNKIQSGYDSINYISECKYQYGSYRLGGDGINIQYEFILETVPIDSGAEINSNLESIRYIKSDIRPVSSQSYYNYASPYTCTEYVGYMRDEIYSFGVVFFDIYGRQSFVNWIGDIRFPRMWDIDNKITYLNKNLTSNISQRTTLTFTINSANTTYITVSLLASEYVFDIGYWNGNPSSLDTIAENLRIALTSNYVECSFIESVLSITHDGIDTLYLDYIELIPTLNNGSFYFTSDGVILPVNTRTFVSGYVGNNDYLTAFKNVDDRKNYANILGIEFTFKTFPSDAVAYRIVRCPVTEQDRTIVFQGIGEPTYIPSGSINQASLNIVPLNIGAALSEYDYSLVNINNPETCFYKNGNIVQSGDFINVPALYSTTGAYKFNAGNTIGGLNNTYEKYTNVIRYGTASMTPLESDRIVIDGRNISIQAKDTNPIQVGNKLYRNHLVDDFLGTYGSRGTNFVLNSSTLDVDSSLQAVHLINYKRSLIPYKGISYSARIQRNYIPCSKIFPISDSIVSMYGGDTYITFFEYMRSLHNFEGGVINGDSIQSWVAFPVETRINLNLRHDKLAKWLQNSEGSGTWTIRETQKEGLTDYPNTYPEDVYDLYLYNSVYSKEDSTILYFPKPVDFVDITKFGTRIKVSNKRIAGNTIDQWLKFPTELYKDVDSPYGDITALRLFKDQLYFFQNTGFGIQPINERTTTVDESGTKIVLGEGEILGKYGYVSRITGCINPTSIVTTEFQMHFFDVKLKKWYMYSSEGLQALSDTKSMANFFNNTLNIPYNTYIQLALDKTTSVNVAPYGIHGVYDIKNNRILMTFLNTSYQNITLSYNLLLGVYESFYDYAPSLYLTAGEKLIAVDNVIYNRNYIYMHGIYFNKSNYYGRMYPDTVIKFITNKNPDNLKVFHAIEYNSVITDVNGDEIRDVLGNYKTLTMFRMLNDYQTTGFKLLVVEDSLGSNSDDPSKLNVRKRFRNWRFKIPRGEKINPEDTGEMRIKSQYAFIEFRYTNILNGSKLLLHDITTYFDIPGL